MHEIRVGLLGAGYIATSHAKALAGIPGVALQTVCDQSIARARALADEFGAAEAVGSIEALAASDVDVVHVLLPPSLHLGAARQLIDAGKAVFLEKPMGPSAAECRQLVAHAEARDVLLGVNHNFLFMPAYQPIRNAAKGGALGAVDHVTINWLYALPLLQFGPFNAWMVEQPGNLMLELGSHLAAFALDLLGPIDIAAAHAANPIDLPGDQRVYRRWNVIGEGDRASMALNLSVSPGQADRSLHVRALGGTAHLDFDKGIGWQEATSSDNPIIDNVAAASRAAGQIGIGATAGFGRYLLRTLRKSPAANPFEESICGSVAAFYAGLQSRQLDPRLTGRFGADVIDLCERIVASGGVSQSASASPAPRADGAVVTQPRILVIGGTGFIGRRLVERLVARGLGVRVLTRSLSSARADLAGMDIELMQGSHADPATVDRALDGIEVVYHLAKAEGRRWSDYVANDIEPTRLLAEAALRHGVRRFVYTGTIDSYASADANQVIDGTTPLDPGIAGRNLYARSKAACEALLQDLARRGLPLVIFRPGVVIGEGSPPAHMGVGRFVSATSASYWGSGENPVPFVLVDDVGDALEKAFDAPGIDGRTFLLTDDPLLSARDYVAAVAARAGGAVAASRHPIWRYWAMDVIKEAAKHLIRHPNRRRPSYHDWACRAHRSRYDARATREALGWNPAGTREALIERGVNASVDRFLR